MIVECSNCHVKYNVDERKVPATGVKVRCNKCQSIIFIKKEEAAPPIIPPEVTKKIEPTPQPEIPAAPKPEIPKKPIPEEIPAPELPTEVPEIPAAPEPELPPGAEPPVIVKPTPAAPELSEEDKKWHERARRLAKALASDLVLYNRQKVEQGLQDKTLVQLLGSEIRRSWEYYCQQIPKHIVDTTDYFKEQLNKIVGKGEELFK